MKRNNLPMQNRLNAAGITTFRTNIWPPGAHSVTENVYLRYKDKTTKRPHVMRCPDIVKTKFGIEI